VHLAFTRVPANPRTQVEVLRMSDEIETKKQDAESIIGDLAEELVDKSLIDDEALVVKTEHDMEDDEEGRDRKKKKEEGKPSPEKSEVTMEQDNQVVEEPVEEVAPAEEKEEEPVMASTPVKSAIDKATDDFKAKAHELKEKGITGDAAIEILQPLFTEMSKVVTEEVNPAKPLTREDVVEVMKSAIPEIVAQVLKGIPAQQPVAQATQAVPTPRSLIVNRNNLPEKGEQELTQIQKMALASTRVGQ